jgi:hypothetical protein
VRTSVAVTSLEAAVDAASRAVAVAGDALRADLRRDRVHVDVSVPHDEAADRISAAAAAGGRLTYVDEASAFWVLADPEGNEACVTTWQGRD